MLGLSCAAGRRRADVGQGILYKPENFDATKRYPVIVHYYEKRSEELHRFRVPEWSYGEINIPWYVSNGYFVCVPDIPEYTQGHPGRSAFEAIESAAAYLATFPWVDTTHLGLQGHSFGGYETNYVVTHSTRFAAAQASAAPVNWLSGYGEINDGGASLTGIYEAGQLRMGTTPWQRPDLYIENSPLFRVDSVTTPLLLMHGDRDMAVPFSQAIEWFTALRRLQKPVWLLVYDGANHSLSDLADQQDFTIRQEQFFDHYLKGAPAPLWMTRGVPAREKGKQSGLQYDR